ncbi:MAG TPA: AraC family transcriptional regulator [Roseiarcus sp.]|nr:AraC family transcriptional regulator [Roseiarcus sp.]
MAFLEPDVRFAPYVARLNVYRERDTAFTRRAEPPSGLATLVFNLGAELRVEHPVKTFNAYGAGGAFYTGISSTFAITETDRAQEGAQAMLTPLGARLLVDFPLAEIGDRLIDPADLFGAAARATIGRLMACNSEEARLAILEAAMAERLERARRPPPADLAFAAQRLQASGGRLSVAALAEEIGCGRKHLTMRFAREFGIAPKLLGRVLRFDRALRRARSGAVPSLAALADSCGYADQAHLTRDFKEFAGAPPAAFMRRALPDDGGFPL